MGEKEVKKRFDYDEKRNLSKNLLVVLERNRC